MSDDLDRLLLQVNEDATALKEYLDRTRNAAQRIEDADAAVRQAVEGLGKTSDSVITLVERTDDLIREVQRIDPGSVRDALTRLDERVNNVGRKVAELAEMRMDRQLEQLRTQLKWVTYAVLGTLLVSSTIAYLGFRLLASG